MRWQFCLFYYTFIEHVQKSLWGLYLRHFKLFSCCKYPIPHKRQKKKKRKKTQLKLFFCLRRVYRLLFCLYICGMFKILEIILIKRIWHNDLSQRAIEKIKMPGKQRSNWVLTKQVIIKKKNENKYKDKHKIVIRNYRTGKQFTV